MQKKRKHHKQPQFYLKGFAAKDDEHPKTSSIWIYKKGANSPKRKGINNTAFTKDFYAFEEDDGSINYNKYEDLLMKDYEQPANSSIEKLRQIEMIDKEEKQKVSRYIGSMICRGDWGRNLHFNALEQSVSKMLDTYQNEYLKEDNKRKIRKIILEGKEQITKGEDFPKSVIRLSNKISEIIENMNWRFLIAPSQTYFLTSDKPFYYTKLDNKYSELLFPISKEVCLLASWIERPIPKSKRLENGFWQLNSKVVETIRDLIVSNSINEVYFSRKADWLVKFVNNRLK